MILKRGVSWGDSGKRWALEQTWHQMADCSKGGSRPPETHDRRQWTAVYVGWRTRLHGWRRPETAAVRIGDDLNVVRKIPWRQTMQASIDKHSQLEVDAFRRPLYFTFAFNTCLSISYCIIYSDDYTVLASKSSLSKANIDMHRIFDQ